MKKIHFILSLVVVAFMYGCSKNNNGPMPSPVGSFTGKFTLWNMKNSQITDTLSVNITLVATADGQFKIGGDTTSLHAGSRGQFSSGFESIEFTDVTAALYKTETTPRPPKIHLNGSYECNFNGHQLQILGLDDNYRYIYTLTKN